MRFVRHVRQSDQADFERWFQSVNTGRTQAVGVILLVFAVFWTTMTLSGVAEETSYHYSIYLYLGFLVSLLIGTGLIWHSLRHRQYKLVTSGEWLILGIAVTWMFVAVDGGIQQSYGLVEFIIGTLALAMLRLMKPAMALLVYTSLAVAYGLILWRHGMAEIAPINNGILFCTFAFILSLEGYNSKVLEYRNRLLLKQLNAHNRQLATWAMRDALTGLPNRRYFDQLLEHYWNDEAPVTKPISLILLDIDHFKEFNDRYGHPAGDECLRSLAEILQSEVRRMASCSRLGGEEFAILQPETDDQQAAIIAERLRERIAAAGQVTVSLGIATTLPNQQSAQAFYIAADQALYTAKRRGRNQVASASRIGQSA